MLLRSISKGIKSLLNAGERNAEIEAEVRSFFESAVEHRMQQGMSREEAECAARAEMGSAETIRHKVWMAGWESYADSLWRDARYSFRQILRAPGLSIVAILSLALGIGANTAIFTVDYATLLAPPPYPQPDRLVTVWIGGDPDRRNPSPENFIDWKRQSRAIQDLSAFAGSTFDIATAGEPESVWGMRVTANYYRTIGSSFYLGRDFLQDEDHEGKSHVVILTHKL